MANHTGSEGVVKVGTSTVAEVRSYSIEQTSDTVEDTTIGDSWRTHKTTLRSWTASLDVFWDELDTNGQSALTVGAEINFRVYPEGDQSTDVYLTGTGIVTSKSISASFDGMVESTIAVQGTGQLSSATA